MKKDTTKSSMETNQMDMTTEPLVALYKNFSDKGTDIPLKNVIGHMVNGKVAGQIKAIRKHVYQGQKLYFKREELDLWRLSNRRSATEEDTLKANEYLMRKERSQK
jgi:hypothetical protein